MTLPELIESVDILSYIAQYTEFEQKGGEFWALSPLKEENTPSFSVNTGLNSFYDFSSGKGGNIITFIKCYHGCSTGEAAKILRQYAGQTQAVSKRPKLEAVKVAKRFCKRPRQLKPSKSEVLPDDYMERYENNPDKLAAWLAEGISLSSLERFQVRYDSFSDRIVYPIRDTGGKIINVSGRAACNDWKERGMRKYTYFKPLGTLDTVYGLAENRPAILERREIILFEGAKSVMLADTWGIPNTAALLTSHLNPNQMRILAALGCRAVFALDKGVNVKEDANIARLSRYINGEYIYDTGGLLQDKMSPVDSGLDTWKTLYSGRFTLK